MNKQKMKVLTRNVLDNIKGGLSDAKKPAKPKLTTVEGLESEVSVMEY